jgi:hypothetical protein
MINSVLNHACCPSYAPLPQLNVELVSWYSILPKVVFNNELGGREAKFVLSILNNFDKVLSKIVVNTRKM